MDNGLEEFLSSSTRLVVIGMGHALRSDDAVGLEVVRLLRAHQSDRLRVFEAHTAPDAFIAPVCHAAPSHVLIVDAAEIGSQPPPGTWRMLDEEEIDEGLCTTHSIPTREVARELRRRCGCAVGFLGIQLCARGTGTVISGAARMAAREVVGAILRALERAETL